MPRRVLLGTESTAAIDYHVLPRAVERESHPVRDLISGALPCEALRPKPRPPPCPLHLLDAKGLGSVCRYSTRRYENYSLLTFLRRTAANLLSVPPQLDPARLLRSLPYSMALPERTRLTSTLRRNQHRYRYYRVAVRYYTSIAAARSKRIPSHGEDGREYGGQQLCDQNRLRYEYRARSWRCSFFPAAKQKIPRESFSFTCHSSSGHRTRPKKDAAFLEARQCLLPRPRELIEVGSYRIRTS